MSGAVRKIMEIINPRTQLRTHVIDEGEGRPIIFIHGWTGNTSRWEPTRKILSARYRTIAYDLRGHGLSDKRKDLQFTFEAFVDDLRGVMEAMGLKRACIAGHSMGGMIAQHFALAHPEMVEKLVLVGTAAHTVENNKEKKKLRGGAWLFRHFFGPMMWIKDRKKKAQPDLFPDAVDYRLRPMPEAASDCIRAIAGMDLRERLKTLAIPTLIVASDTDGTVAVRLSDELARCIPGAIYERITGCGHHIPIERSEFLAGKMAAFIS